MSHLNDPAILFFLLGVLAGAVRSNLRIPPPVAQFLALYLLMALGLKGGFALSKTGLSWDVLTTLVWAVTLAVLIPLVAYALLRRFTDPLNAAALSAAYGSVSAVTFLTAQHRLEADGLAPGGHLTAAMVLMESPAILMALALAHKARQATRSPVDAVTTEPARSAHGIAGLLRESFTEGAQVLLLGSMAIGLVTAAHGETVLKPFTGDLFKGLLCFFLLDMGLMVAQRIREARDASVWLIAYALGGPLAHALLALAGAWLLDLSIGDTVLLMVLAASASYIVVPAVVRDAIPEANPALYLGLSLGVTFPFNLLLGIPLYTEVASRLLR